MQLLVQEPVLLGLTLPNCPQLHMAEVVMATSITFFCWHLDLWDLSSYFVSILKLCVYLFVVFYTQRLLIPT